MDREKQRQIASKGGRAAHAKGTAHEFTHQEAVEAGRKGGRAAQARGHAQRTGPNEPAPAEELQSPSAAGSWQGEESTNGSSERTSSEHYASPMTAEHVSAAPV
jgi:hypothetical protein